MSRFASCADQPAPAPDKIYIYQAHGVDSCWPTVRLAAGAMLCRPVLSMMLQEVPETEDILLTGLRVFGPSLRAGVAVCVCRAPEDAHTTRRQSGAADLKVFLLTKFLADLGVCI